LTSTNLWRKSTVRIASGPSIIAIPSVRTAAAQSLAAGEDVFVKAATAAEVANATPYSPEIKRHIEAGRANVAGVRVSDSILSKLNLPGMAVGSATGLVAGAAIGVIIEQIRSAHPASAVAFDAAFAALGSSLGGAVGSGLFTIKPTWNPNGEIGVEISPVAAK
jgi:hypothetical protein